MAFVFLRVGTWVHLILNLTHTSKRWPDQFSKSGRDISKSISIPAKLVQQNWNQHEIMQLWEIDFFFFPKNVLRPFLISHKLYCLNGVPFKHSTTKEKVTYRPFSHAKQSHTEALQGRGTETPITTTDTQNNQVCFLFLVCVFTAFLCILLHSLQTSFRLKKSFSFQDSTPFQIIPDTQLSIIPTGSLMMGDFNVLFFVFFLSHHSSGFLSVFLWDFCQKGSTHPVFSQTNCNWLKLILHRNCFKLPSHTFIQAYSYVTFTEVLLDLSWIHIS